MNFPLRTIVACCALLAGSLLAQENTGDIRGTVKDNTGAVVPNATVEIKNTDQNSVLRTLTTGKDGAYLAPALPIGHYQVTITAPGFKSFTGSNLMLNVADHRIVDVALGVGPTEQQVDVTESPVQVDLDTNEASGLITGTQIRELSVLSRNFVQLVALQPGVTTDFATDQFFVGASNPTGFSNQINVSINGNRPTQNSWIIDGADDFDRGANLTLLAYPSVDSIAEMKVLRSNFLPEHGRTSSGEISIVTRGGTNSFHGNAYEFFRNDVLNANQYFLKRSQLAQGLPNKPPPVRWNDFGFTFGGPIVKDKTFFFYSQEWRKLHVNNVFTSSWLPSSSELAGIFPFPICNSFNAAQTCTGTGTTVANINPVAAAYVKDVFSKLPASNSVNQQLVSSLTNIYNYREEAVRIDQNLGSRWTFFGRYSDDSIPTMEPAGLYTGEPLPGVSTTQTNAPGRLLSLHATTVFTPNLLNNVGYAFSWGGVLSDPIGTLSRKRSPDINPTLPYPSSAAIVPQVSFDYVQGLFGFGAYRDYNKNHTIFDNLSWQRGTHALKFGGQYNFYIKDENENNYPNYYVDSNAGCPNAGCTGVLSNADQSPEQNWANFLLGRVNTYSQAQAEFRDFIHQQQYEFYAQDEWRVRPNLTLDYGLRYSLFKAPIFVNNLLSTFDPKLYDRSKAPALAPDGTYAGTVNIAALSGLIQGGHNSPYGQAVVPTPKLNFAPRIGFAWDPFGTGKTSIRGGYGIFFDSPAVNNHENAQSSNPTVSATALAFNTTFSNPTAFTPPASAPPTVWGPNPAKWATPYSEMFDFDIQQQLSKTMMFDIGYYGNLGRHLMGVVDINMPRPGAFQKIPGYCATPGCTFHALDYQLLTLVRPYQGFDALNLFTPVFTSNYNGLQTQFQKQFSSSSQIVVSYTWSHTLTTASGDYRSAQNTYNLRGDYGNSDFDRRHVFTASYVYFLPFFKNQEGITGHVLGGWELSGIAYLNTGRHYTASYSSCNNLHGDPAGLGLCGNTNSGARPDLIGDPNAGAPNTVAKWFNTSAFAVIPAGQVRPGNEPRGTIVGPADQRLDASLFKNIKLTERFNLQFRSEFFNVLNHTNFGQGAPASAFSSLRFGSSVFGRIANARDPRQIQLALKLQF